MKYFVYVFHYIMNSLLRLHIFIHLFLYIFLYIHTYDILSVDIAVNVVFCLHILKNEKRD